jgi:hypothetical protein
MNAVQGTGALREASFGTSVCATKAGSQECDVRVEVRIENTSLGVYRPPNVMSTRDHPHTVQFSSRFRA